MPLCDEGLIFGVNHMMNAPIPPKSLMENQFQGDNLIVVIIKKCLITGMCLIASGAIVFYLLSTQTLQHVIYGFPKHSSNEEQGTHTRLCEPLTLNA